MGSTGPRTGQAGPHVQGDAARVAITPGGRLSVDLGAWRFWWEFRKEPFLQLKDHVFAEAAETGVEDFYLGYGQRSFTSGARAPTDDDVRDRIVPALLAALAAEDSNDIVSGCLVALARVADGLDEVTGRTVEEALRLRLRSSNQEIAETAAIALGILARESSAPLASALLFDTPAAHEALGRRSVPQRTRAFAAFGLGLIGARTSNEDVRRYVVHELARALEMDDESMPDIGVACALGLGRVPLACSGERPERDKNGNVAASASRECQIAFLLDVLRDRRRDRIVRSHVPTALGTLVAEGRGSIAPQLVREVTQELMDRVCSKNAPRELIQSAVAALGMIGDGDDDDLDVAIRKLLLKLDASVSDRHARNLGMIALARVSARAPDGAGPDQVQVRRHFLEKLGRGSAEARWAGLSLALFERGLAERGTVTAESARDGLSRALADANSPNDVGAYAIACGLVGAPEAEATLLAKLEETRDDQGRGFVAVGLGLVGARGAVEPMRAMLAESTYRPELLRELAIALALLDDREATSALIDMLEGASSLAAQASIAQALGRIGDRATIAPLIEHLQDTERTARSRAFAAAALGIVGDRDPLPWNTELSVMVNYMAAPPTLFDSAGFGVLNIL